MALILAPMEGVLDATLRDILTRFGGVDWCVSEFVRVTGTRLPQRTFLRMVPELEHGSRTPCGIPVRAQLLGSDPDSMARNAERLASLQPHGIDINFGCPANIVNRHGGGAALLDTPEVVEAVVAAVRKAVPAPMVVSAKMRLGVNDDRRAEECARAIESGGAQQLVVHARTKVQGYQPPAHWGRIREIREAVRIPVVANGEIWSVEDARRCIEESGCRDLMLGRGMVADPGLALAIRQSAVFSGESPAGDLPAQRLNWNDVVPALRELWMRHAGFTSVPARAGRLKQWLVFLKRRFPPAAELFGKIRASNDADFISKQLNASEQGGGIAECEASG
jgi:tRNA-dihydrouridine synthase C